MPIDVTILSLAVAAVIGAILAALLGWAESAESFNAKKLLSSVIRAIVAGILITVGYQYAPSITTWDYLWSFLAGAGIDVLGNRVAGTILK